MDPIMVIDISCILVQIKGLWLVDIATRILGTSDTNPVTKNNYLFKLIFDRRNICDIAFSSIFTKHNSI